ncbi:hypothetical protein EB796_009399 [Bugula neritina]|uniref:Uncharacterized protein n=1 Tax=Bugula neritina TaxID=10212 RepID=A0A7J7K3Y0_BUGNE|nr:hypothetical protein EB796_009399 [Bugula neritina]
MKSFYGGLREVYGPVKRGTSQLTALDGNTVLQEKSEILNRFADHFAQLLNVPGTLDIKAAIDIETRPEVHCLSEPQKCGKFGEEESRDVLGKFDNFSEKTSNKTIKKHQLLSTKQECLSIDEYVTNLHRL